MAKVGTLLILILALAQRAQAQQDTFPRNKDGHRYAVTWQQIQGDSLAGAQLVSLWLSRPEGSVTAACLYGHPSDEDLPVHVFLDSAVYAPTINADSLGPLCLAGAIGASYFVNGQFAVDDPGMKALLFRHKDWVIVSAVYGVQPVPLKDAVEMHIPTVVPRLYSIVYAPEEQTPKGVERKT